MEVWINPKTGFKDLSFRPYSEYMFEGKSSPPYSPNGSGYNFGLYQTAQPACGSWLNNLHQFQNDQMKGNNINTPVPAMIVDKTGTLHRVPYYITDPYTAQNYGVRYDTLLRNAKQVGNQNL